MDSLTDSCHCGHQRVAHWGPCCKHLPCRCRYFENGGMETMTAIEGRAIVRDIMRQSAGMETLGTSHGA